MRGDSNRNVCGLWDLLHILCGKEETVRIEEAIIASRAELESATRKFGPFLSLHEGHSVIEEEFDELWDEIKRLGPHGCDAKLKHEATQLAAMALRFLVDLCE